MPRLSLSYQTASISLFQFLTVLLLGIPDTIINIVSTCHSDSSNCVSNMVVSLIFYLLTAGWFAIIMVLGHLAQIKRSRQFAVLLMGFEAITFVVAGYIDFPHDSNVLSKLTSALDAFLSLVVIYLAIRLFLSGGRRIVRKQNPISRNRKSA